MSNVFLRPKPDGFYRMILNLKKLNKFVDYNEFKMDTLRSVLKLVTSKCYMATIALKDAYYTVPIAEEHRKYLRFYWRGKPYQYTCFPNGLSSAPRLFTKLMKSRYAKLRLCGHTVSGYIDLDTYLQSDDFNVALNSLTECNSMFSNFGFLVHPEKSMSTPSQKVKVLGRNVDSIQMTVSLTPEKKNKFKNFFLLKPLNLRRAQLEILLN